jgi:hypothetical protein
MAEVQLVAEKGGKRGDAQVPKGGYGVGKEHDG